MYVEVICILLIILYLWSILYCKRNIKAEIEQSFRKPDMVDVVICFAPILNLIWGVILDVQIRKITNTIPERFFGK